MANSHRLFFIIGLVLLCALLIAALSRNAFGQEEDPVRLDVPRAPLITPSILDKDLQKLHLESKRSAPEARRSAPLAPPVAEGEVDFVEQDVDLESPEEGEKGDNPDQGSDVVFYGSFKYLPLRMQTGVLEAGLAGLVAVSRFEKVFERPYYGVEFAGYGISAWFNVPVDAVDSSIGDMKRFGSLIEGLSAYALQREIEFNEIRATRNEMFYGEGAGDLEKSEAKGLKELLAAYIARNGSPPDPKPLLAELSGFENSLFSGINPAKFVKGTMWEGDARLDQADLRIAKTLYGDSPKWDVPEANVAPPIQMELLKGKIADMKLPPGQEPKTVEQYVDLMLSRGRPQTAVDTTPTAVPATDSGPATPSAADGPAAKPDAASSTDSTSSETASDTPSDSVTPPPSLLVDLADIAADPGADPDQVLQSLNQSIESEFFNRDLAAISREFDGTLLYDPDRAERLIATATPEQIAQLESIKVFADLTDARVIIPAVTPIAVDAAMVYVAIQVPVAGLVLGGVKAFGDTYVQETSQGESGWDATQTALLNAGLSTGINLAGGKFLNWGNAKLGEVLAGKGYTQQGIQTARGLYDYWMGYGADKAGGTAANLATKGLKKIAVGSDKEIGQFVQSDLGGPLTPRGAFYHR